MGASSATKWLEPYVVIGVLQRAYALEGEIRAEPSTFDPDRIQDIKTLFLGDPKTETVESIQVESSRVHMGSWYFRFVGYNTPEAVDVLRYKYLMLPVEERLPLEPGMYYYGDLIGFTLTDFEGNTVGHIEDIEEMPSTAIFHSVLKGKKICIPWIEDCVGEVNTENKTIPIDLDYLKELLE
jgi:16S rRNA processing protein RimM